MAEFQDLEIRLQAVDNASKTLEKVVSLLERVKELTGSGSSTSTSNTTNTTKAQVQATKSIADVSKKAAASTQSLVNAQKSLISTNYSFKTAAQGSTNAQISLTNAQNRAAKASAEYAQAQENSRLAVERLAAAEQKLKQAQSDKELMSRENIGNLTPSESARYNELSDIMWNTDALYVDKQLASAKKELAAAQKNVETTAKQEKTAHDTLVTSLNSVQSATNRVEKENERLEKRNQNTARSFVTLAAKITTVVRVFRRLTQGLFSAIKESGEFVENLNLFAVTFGENYQETLDWALEFADNLGVASNEIVRFTGLFKQLADSIGITQDTATEMSQVLTQLGYDLASFYNISTESAFEKLQAGIFSGQTKPLNNKIAAICSDIYRKTRNMRGTPKDFGTQCVKIQNMQQWKIRRDSLYRKPSTTTNAALNQVYGIVYSVA